MQSFINNNPSAEYLNPQQMLQTPNCPICGGHGKELLKMPTINPNAKEKIGLVECSRCCHWWNNPLPDQKYLLELYAQDSAYVVSSNGVHKFNELNPMDLQRFLRPINRDFPKGKKFNYLEIGPGAGHALRYFSKMAEAAWGVEPAPAQKDLNIVASIEEVPSHLVFDCLVAQDVLEHVTDPVLMLTQLRSRARKGSLLYAGFPNKDSFKARLMKDKWSMVRPVGHLQYFSSRSIDTMLKKAGWQLIEKRPARIGDLNALEIIKGFDYKVPNLPYRLVKSLLLGQLLLGKDQWKILAKAEEL